MIIIGCDFHPSWQQIAWVDTETGETGERKLMHATGEAEQFYRGLVGPVRVGLESTGNGHWFVDGRSRTQLRLGVRIEESWPWLGRIDGWWNGKSKTFPRMGDSKSDAFQSLRLQLLWRTSRC